MLRGYYFVYGDREKTITVLTGFTPGGVYEREPFHKGMCRRV